MAIWLPLSIVVSACGTTAHDDGNGSGGTGASVPSDGASGGTADGSGGSSGTSGGLDESSGGLDESGGSSTGGSAGRGGQVTTGGSAGTGGPATGGGSGETGGADNTGGQSTGSTGGAEGGACVQPAPPQVDCAELVTALRLGAGATLDGIACNQTGHDLGAQCSDPTYGPCVCADMLGTTPSGPALLRTWVCPVCNGAGTYPPVPPATCEGLPADVGAISAGHCYVLSCDGRGVRCASNQENQCVC